MPRATPPYPTDMKYLHIIQSLLIVATMWACQAKPGPQPTSDEQRDIIKRVNDLSMTRPTEALALLDSAEQRHAMQPIDINAMRSVVYNNAQPANGKALKYAIMAANDTAIGRDPKKQLLITALLATEYYTCGSYDHSLLAAEKGIAMARKLKAPLQEASLLLTSYTNRAVDEICAMLTEAGIDYLRIGNEYTCDPRFRDQLLDRRVGETPRLDHVRQTLLSARVVVATTTTLQSRTPLFTLRRFSLAIIDEASQILEPSLMGLLTHIDKFVMVGDYKQLPAVVQQPAALSQTTDPLLTAIHLTDCRNSLFERLYRREMALGRTQFVGILRRQGRMHPDIASFPNEMFYRREQLECVPLPHQQTDVIYPTPLPHAADGLDTLLHHHRLLYFPSAGNLSPTQSDKVNPVEARIVARIVGRIYSYCGKSFDPDRTVGVIVPYRNQIAMIRREIEQMGIEPLTRISIDTVERYQGSQRDVIIYSFTIQHAYQLDFLTANCMEEDGLVIDRKLNVALTRARKQLIITGHESTLRQNALFAKLLDHIRSREGYAEPQEE